MGGRRKVGGVMGKDGRVVKHLTWNVEGLREGREGCVAREERVQQEEEWGRGENAKELLNHRSESKKGKRSGFQGGGSGGLRAGRGRRRASIARTGDVMVGCTVPGMEESENFEWFTGWI